MTEETTYPKMPVNVLIKPVSGSCNLRCAYCFYTDEMDNRSIGNCGVMTKETARVLIRKFLDGAQGHCHFGFQGGEPVLAGLSFYEFFVDCVNQYKAADLEVTYSIQTNGTLLDEKWAEFLGKHGFLVGVSLDGTEEVHDSCRKDRNGNGTFGKVMDGIALLKQYHVDFNILTVVHRETVRHTNLIYNFFRRNQFWYQQYVECLDPLYEAAGQQSYSLTPEEYGVFLKTLFRKWYRDMMQGRYVYIRYFENLLFIMAGHCPESCSMWGRCGKQWVVEADGSVYPCDFYALDEWKLGNILDHSVQEMDERRDQSGFIAMSEKQPEQCLSCKWFVLCRNGCRRNCEPVRDGMRSVNYFCSAYREFFEYAYPGLKEVYDRWVSDSSQNQ